MSTRAGAVPLSDLQFLKIYFNRKRLRSTPANLRKMLAEAGLPASWMRQGRALPETGG